MFDFNDEGRKYAETLDKYDLSKYLIDIEANYPVYDLMNKI